MITKINEGLPEGAQHRYGELFQKSVSGSLSESEHKEFLSLATKSEEKQTERLSHLLELAALWNMSVDEVMKKLDIQVPPVISN